MSMQRNYTLNTYKFIRLFSSFLKTINAHDIVKTWP